MYFGILHILPGMRTKHTCLLRRPSKPTCEVGERKAVNSTSNVGTRPVAQLFEMLITRPGVGRPFALHLNNILEAGGCEVLLVLGGGEYWASEIPASFKTELAPLGEVAVGVQGVVVGTRREAHVLELEVAARLEVVECYLDDLREILEAAEHHSSKDEVELFSPGPLLFEVVDLEDKIWGNTSSAEVVLVSNSWVKQQRYSDAQRWLNWAQINANHLQKLVSIYIRQGARLR